MTDNKFDVSQFIADISATAASAKYRTDYLDYVDDVELDPVAGQKVIGTLTDDEIVEYKHYIATDAAYADLVDDINADYNNTLARVISAHHGQPTQEEINAALRNRLTDDEIEEYWHLQFLVVQRSSAFWYKLRFRLQTFATNISIREGFTVVSLGRK